MNYCKQCGEKVSLEIPENDNRERFICVSCETIHYENPNIIAGVLPIMENPVGQDASKDKVLLCRRAIEPRYGLWTLPAGFMENGETVEQAAIRESEEEANLTLDNLQLYTVMSLPHISQVYMIFMARITDDRFSPGIESLETELFDEQQIPWGEIAFPVMTKTLQCYFKDRLQQQYPVHNLVYETKK